MFDHRDGVMQGLAKKKAQWKEDILFAMKFVWHNMSRRYTEVTPTTGLRLIVAYILDTFRKLRSVRKWDK
jgi:hypothetical protein